MANNEVKGKRYGSYQGHCCNAIFNPKENDAKGYEEDFIRLALQQCGLVLLWVDDLVRRKALRDYTVQTCQVW